MPTIANIDTGAHVEWAGFISGLPVFAMSDGHVSVLDGRERKYEVHPGLCLATAELTGKTLVTAGEDGSLTRFHLEGRAETLRAATGKWVDALATGPGGALAASSGRVATVLTGTGDLREIASERSIEGLAFAPKGMRIAMARYNGVELAWVNSQGSPVFLEWKGAHTGVTFSPDGKYVVSMMQENALHGWRLADSKHMRMSGYPAKVKSLSWSAKGAWLASSGAPAAIVWPFTGKDGPMGKAPRELGAMGQVLVTRVACHPQEEVVAIGYGDGMILAVRIADGKEAALRRGGKGAISTLQWDAGGKRLAFGSEEGEAGVIDIGA
ncbi:MAG: WD40 repeat domain-containing protein [Nitratireductor sp.]|nr:WD40 repeat domain-containing protein [Nitratireductor sp.]MCB1460537.1 WD40 repeat domain-containing protein [Nitratireductor sp.]